MKNFLSAIALSMALVSIGNAQTIVSTADRETPISLEAAIGYQAEQASFQISALDIHPVVELQAAPATFYTGISRLIFNHWKHTATNPWGGCSVRYGSTFSDGIDGQDNMGSTATLGLVRGGFRLLTERRRGTDPDTLYLSHGTGSAMWGTFRISIAMGTGSLFVPGTTAYLYDLKTGSITDVSAGLFQLDSSFNGPVYYDYTAVQSDPSTYGTRFMIVIHPPAN